MRLFPASLAPVAALAIAHGAAAQSNLPPLPPPGAESGPPPAATAPAQSAPVQPPPPPAVPAQPPPAYTPPPPQYTYVAPPPGPPGMSQARVETHAPRFSFWAGARLGGLAYMGGLYVIDPYSVETIGNFVRPGLALEADVGARLAKRYILFVPLELGLVGAGHRFEGTSTNANTTFFGLGLRLLSGDVDSVSFASDISLGFRTFQVSNSSGTWSATAFEFLRLGLGAEIRLSTLFTLTPMLTLSGGSVTDVSGNIAFAPNQGDGLTGPLYHDNQSIGGSQSSYYSFVLGCGAHFDLFGK